MEEFRTAFENYEISNLGNLRRKLHNGTYRPVKGSILNTGGSYRYLQLKRGGKRKNILFHRMVAKAFLGEQPEDKPYVDHINRNSQDNRLVNLRWINHQDNLRNTDRFRDDIKEEGRERHRQLRLSARNNTLELKKYYCELCDTNCQAPSHLDKHNDGFRHKLKTATKLEMEAQGIEWNSKNYLKFKRIKYDINRVR